MIGCIVIIRTRLFTLIPKLIVSTLTFWKRFIFIYLYLFSDVIVVSTIVGNVQSTIAVNEGKVTVAVQTTRTSCTQGNQVAVIYIVDGCRSVAEHRSGISIY